MTFENYKKKKKNKYVKRKKYFNLMRRRNIRWRAQKRNDHEHEKLNCITKKSLKVYSKKKIFDFNKQ